VITPAPTPASAAPMAPTPALAPSPSAAIDAILAGHAKAVAPAGRIASAQGIKTTANSEIPAMGMNASMIAVQRRPNQTSMTIGLPGIGEMRQGFDGTTAWASDPMQGPRLMRGNEAAAQVDAADFRTLTRPAELFSASEVVGEGEVDGQTCTKVKHTWKSGRITTDCYSTTTFLILETTAVQSTPQGDIEATQRYSDFRRENGIMLPHKVVITAMGMQQIVTTTSMEFGEQPAAAFEPPAEVKALKKP